MYLCISLLAILLLYTWRQQLRLGTDIIILIAGTLVRKSNGSPRRRDSA